MVDLGTCIYAALLQKPPFFGGCVWSGRPRKAMYNAVSTWMGDFLGDWETLHKYIMLFYNNRTSHITDSWEKLETTANECLLSFCIQTFPPLCPRNADEENEIMSIVKLEPAHKLLFMHTNLEPEFDFVVLKNRFWNIRMFSLKLDDCKSFDNVMRRDDTLQSSVTAVHPHCVRTTLRPNQWSPDKVVLV